jgi:hypothetical protein
MTASLAPSLLQASAAVVRRSGLLVPVGAAVLLVAATAHLFDDGHAGLVLRGTGILLACAWVTTVDDPMGEVAAGSAYPRSTRTLARAMVGLVLVVPVWGAAILLVELRAPELSVLPPALEAAGLGVAGVAIAAGLRAWTNRHQPSYLAIPCVLALAVTIHSLPRSWTMLPLQTWGPPWQAVQLRWTGVILICVAVLVWAVQDPLARRPRPHRRVAGSLAGP